MNQGNKHWIQAVLDENPFLPFNYFYDEVHVVVLAAARASPATASSRSSSRPGRR